MDRYNLIHIRIDRLILAQALSEFFLPLVLLLLLRVLFFLLLLLFLQVGIEINGRLGFGLGITSRAPQTLQNAIGSRIGELFSRVREIDLEIYRERKREKVGRGRGFCSAENSYVRFTR